MKKLMLFLLITLVSNRLADAQHDQSLIYRVTWNGDSIGFLKATKSIASPEKIIYFIDSRTKFRILFNFKLDYKYQNTYVNNQLVEAGTGSMLNGKERSTTKILKTPKGYQVQVDEDESFLEQDSIQSTIAALYHHEPPKGGSIFSERYGQFCKFVKEQNSVRYAFHKPSGRVNYYTFNNDRCEKVEVNNRFATIFFELVEVVAE